LLAFSKIQNKMKRVHLKVICILNCVFSAGCSPIRVFKKGNLRPENDILAMQQYLGLGRIGNKHSERRVVDNVKLTGGN